ncbi:hypothetical protein POM88_053540 [Heracleum sosnowskyi]|uniref:Uncharacterized protein n=1 Tax=Heracleum sosnowskyi TaxID=360622 RepID=A0AAD8LX19_9APIA|nr:hypothetical protein POM88_053540 [Heracleum sosnowskyi]
MEIIFQALNAEDDMVEDSSSSLAVNPAKSKQHRDVPSVEDLNWADSCLVSDAEHSDPNWTSLLDALADALSSRSYAPASSASERDSFSKETEPLVSVETTAFDSASIPAINKLEMNSDKYPIDDQSDASPLESTYENLFLPTYNEGTKAVDDFVAEFDSEFPVYAMEQRNESIFQEWDIDIPEVEDELAKQLQKILSGGNTSQADPSSIDDTGVLEASRGQSIDDLVAGYVDLSIDDLISGVSDLSLNGYSASWTPSLNHGSQN